MINKTSVWVFHFFLLIRCVIDTEHRVEGHVLLYKGKFKEFQQVPAAAGEVSGATITPRVSAVGPRLREFTTEELSHNQSHVYDFLRVNDRLQNAVVRLSVCGGNFTRVRFLLTYT